MCQSGSHFSIYFNVIFSKFLTDILREHVSQLPKSLSTPTITFCTLSKMMNCSLKTTKQLLQTIIVLGKVLNWKLQLWYNIWDYSMSKVTDTLFHWSMQKFVNHLLLQHLVKVTVMTVSKLLLCMVTDAFFSWSICTPLATIIFCWCTMYDINLATWQNHSKKTQ